MLLFKAKHLILGVDYVKYTFIRSDEGLALERQLWNS